MEKHEKRRRETFTLHPGVVELLNLISLSENRTKSRTVENIIKYYAKSHPDLASEYKRIFITK